MSLGSLILGLYLLFLGAVQLGWLHVSYKFVGVMTLATGIIWLLDGYHPTTWFGNRRG